MSGKTWILAGLCLAAAALAYMFLSSETEAPIPTEKRSEQESMTVAIFGANGTAGDGILKAAMEDLYVKHIHVITRRSSPRIDQGVKEGSITATKHLDYLDYSPILDVLKDVDVVFWALGTSAGNVSSEQYSVIHVDFPIAFVKEWMNLEKNKPISFHLVSGMGADSDSYMHWAKEKARAERELRELTKGTNLKMIAYRPGYIAPSEERSNLGHNLMKRAFSPFNLSISSEDLGRAMLEVVTRGDEIPSGTVLENKAIVRLGNSYGAAKKSN